MPRRHRHHLTPVEWLIIMSILGIVLSIAASPRRQTHRRTHRAAPARTVQPQAPASPVQLPETAKRTAPTFPGLRLWQAIGSPLVLIAALKLFVTVLRRTRRARAGGSGTPGHTETKA